MAKQAMLRMQAAGHIFWVSCWLTPVGPRAYYHTVEHGDIWCIDKMMPTFPYMLMAL